MALRIVLIRDVRARFFSAIRGTTGVVGWKLRGSRKKNDRVKRKRGTSEAGKLQERRRESRVLAARFARADLPMTSRNDAKK